MNSVNGNTRILCGDFNVSLERDNAHTIHLKQFIERNDLHVSWDHESQRETILIIIIISLLIKNHVLIIVL